jgi:hypothetical protein
MACLLAADAQFCAHGDHLVVGLHDCELGDALFEPSASRLAPPGSECTEAKFHHGLEREQDGLRADEVAVALGERVGAVVE